MRSVFSKKENPIFLVKLGQRLAKFLSQLHVKNSRFFLSYFLKKRRLAQGIRRLKAADSPLSSERFTTYRYRNALLNIISVFYLSGTQKAFPEHPHCRENESECATEAEKMDFTDDSRD